MFVLRKNCHLGWIVKAGFVNFEAYSPPAVLCLSSSQGWDSARTSGFHSCFLRPRLRRALASGQICPWTWERCGWSPRPCARDTAPLTHPTSPPCKHYYDTTRIQKNVWKIEKGKVTLLENGWHFPRCLGCKTQLSSPAGLAISEQENCDGANLKENNMIRWEKWKWGNEQVV